MGSHGLSWRAGSTEVERVSCQARLLGVKPGWSISPSVAVVLLQGTSRIFNQKHQGCGAIIRVKCR